MKEIANYPELQLTCYDSGKDGYYLKSSKTGNEYTLLEGKSYKGTTTSDLIFILLYDDETGDTTLINYTCGATDNYGIDMCAEMIADYENGIPALENN